MQQPHDKINGVSARFGFLYLTTSPPKPKNIKLMLQFDTALIYVISRKKHHDSADYKPLEPMTVEIREGQKVPCDFDEAYVACEFSLTSKYSVY